MTNKEKAIERAVFFAHEKPSELAEFIAPLIADTATSLTIKGPISVTLDTESGSDVIYSGCVLSQFGDAMADEVTYSLESPVEGISISENKVSIQTTVSDATEYTVVAKSGDLTSKITTTVTVVPTE